MSFIIEKGGGHRFTNDSLTNPTAGWLVADATITANTLYGIPYLNTGTMIGLGANIFGEGFHKKYIPSFQWGLSDRTDFDKFIKTCKQMYSRRNKKLSATEINFLRFLYNKK